MEELRPCPFCGHGAGVHYWANDESSCTIMCENQDCRASVSAKSCGSMTTAYVNARRAWNRRAVDAGALLALADEMEGDLCGDCRLQLAAMARMRPDGVWDGD